MTIDAANDHSARQNADCRMNALSDILLIGGLVLFALKFGLARGFFARLKELARVVDGLVNVLLVVIVLAYGTQLLFYFFKQRGH
jgi:hypothetical protein